MAGSLFEILFPPVYVGTLLLAFRLGYIPPVVFAVLLVALPAVITGIGIGVFIHYTKQ